MKCALIFSGLLIFGTSAFAQDTQVANSGKDASAAPDASLSIRRPVPSSEGQQAQQSGPYYQPAPQYQYPHSQQYQSAPQYQFLSCVHSQDACHHLAENSGYREWRTYFTMQYCAPEPHLACYGVHHHHHH